MIKAPNAKASDISFEEGLIRLAATHGRRIAFSYAKDDKSPIERREGVPETVFRSISPEAASTQVTTFTLRDTARKAWRQFRLDRVVGEPEIL